MHLDEVLPYFENKKSKLAEALGLKRQAINRWKDEILPREHELRIRYEILPEVFNPQKSDDDAA